MSCLTDSSVLAASRRKVPASPGTSRPEESSGTSCILSGDPALTTRARTRTLLPGKPVQNACGCPNTSYTPKLMSVSRWLNEPRLFLTPRLVVNGPKEPGRLLGLGDVSIFGSATRTSSPGALISQTARTVLTAIVGRNRTSVFFIR